MILPMIQLGLFLGRWPRVALVAAALLWPLILLVGDVLPFGPDVVGASVLAIVNCGVGVLIHQLLLRCVRRIQALS